MMADEIEDGFEGLTGVDLLAEHDTGGQCWTVEQAGGGAVRGGPFRGRVGGGRVGGSPLLVRRGRRVLRRDGCGSLRGHASSKAAGLRRVARAANALTSLA
jgi:hypothetical protein